MTVSTLSDLYSGIVAAIGTLKGPLHGGANEEAWKVLERVGSPENAEHWIKDALARKERIMGFGHRVYKNGDPRATILKRYCIELAKEVGDDRWERIAEPIERVVTTQKQLPPNVDWPSARLYHYMGLDIDLYTPIFAMARVAGWAAHVIEQLDHNRLMRPRARYIGPPHRQVKPIKAALSRSARRRRSSTGHASAGRRTGRLSPCHVSAWLCVAGRRLASSASSSARPSCSALALAFGLGLVVVCRAASSFFISSAASASALAWLAAGRGFGLALRPGARVRR